MRAVVVLLALLGCHHWSVRDTVLDAAMVTVTAADWHQTLHITDDCRETNPVVGTCGDGIPPSAYFPLVILAAAGVAAVLPPAWRGVFLGVLIGVEASTVYYNLYNMHYL